MRERFSIDADWRFHLGDPADRPAVPAYDDWPVVAQGRGATAATTGPATVAAASRPAVAVLKPWILPTANPFVADPAHQHARQTTGAADSGPFAQRNFDDGRWRRVDLPHDWAVDGPFVRGQVGGGMGALPSRGFGWYRKRLDIPAADAGRSIFLDVDGAMSYAVVWLSGHLVVGWPYGYASWRVDLTPYVVPGGVQHPGGRATAADATRDGL